MTAEGFSEDAEDLFWSILTDADSGADGDKFMLRLDHVLEFVEPPDFEQPTDSDDDGTYEVTVKVSNGADADPVGAGNSAVVVDLSRCGPMLSLRVPHHVPLLGCAGSPRCAFAPLEGP